MEIDEYFTYRKELLDESKDSEGFIQETLVLSQVLPLMLDAKLIDSEDFNNSYFISRSDKLKVNAYCVNESGERLQLFVIDESSIDLSLKDEKLYISTKSYYDGQFKRCVSFFNKARKRHLNDSIQDSSPVRPLVSRLSSSEGIEQYDVVEIFLISATATVSLRGSKPQPRRIDFDDNELNVLYTKDRESREKKITLKRRLIDLNFLFSVLISQGNREALIVDFDKIFGMPLKAIKAAEEEHFESYLCVLPATIIASLYKDFSTRLLEKNVRSFLQFRGVNKGIRETIRKEPEKFVAYNNGLTITATDADIVNESGQYCIKSLTDFQIVNGGQTTATIYFTQKDGFDISKVKVMAKINVAKETSGEELEELISNISTYSNAQSRVSKVDLRSRNPQLIKIKSLSESVMTPSGSKWFFERAKGEFNTKMRIAGTNKGRLTKEYPKERRFSKELMAKYYCAWGDQPHLVKKGGEKIFRYFIEELSGEGKSKKTIAINRNFYEELIAKIMLFRKLEKIYGSGKKSMGQLRSAVVPYTISILYTITDGNKKELSFDLLNIWLNEGLGNDLESYLTKLLRLVNALIKKYSESDDYGEYSKKIELWDTIRESSEVKEFVQSFDTIAIIEKYGISKQSLNKRKGENEKVTEIDFKHIFDNVLIHSNGQNYYESIRDCTEFVDPVENRLLTKITAAIHNKEDLAQQYIDFENKITNKFRIENPSFFDKVKIENNFLYETLNYIISLYHKCLDQRKNVVSEFSKVAQIGAKKGIKYTSVYNSIGRQMELGNPPTIKQIYQASNLHNNQGEDHQPPSPTIDVDSIQLDEYVLRKMFEWDNAYNVLTEGRRNYIAEFAWGLKKLTKFHEEHVRKHLKTLVESGFKL